MIAEIIWFAGGCYGKKEVEFTVNGNSIDGKEELSVKVKGLSEMPFWNHDLKIEAALALLSTVDRKEFYEDNQEELFNDYMDQLRETMDYLQF